MANSAPAPNRKPNVRRDLLLSLAKEELAHCPAVFDRLCAEIESDSPVAQRMIDSIQPGMIVLAQHPEATGVSMSTIETGAKGKITAWARSQPDFKEPTPTPPTSTGNDTEAKLAQLDAHIAAFTRPGPMVRKKPSILFVTDRRQSKPSLSVVGQMQQAGTAAGQSMKGVDTVGDISQAADRGQIRHKRYLVKHYPALANYFSEASRNGLTTAAWSGKHGLWYEGDFKKWAISLGYLTEPASKKTPKSGKTSTTLRNAWSAPVSYEPKP